MKRIRAIAIKEFKEIWRNRLFLILAFIVPFLMFVVFGYGISLDIENMPSSYIDHDGTRLSRDLVDRFIGRYFKLTRTVSDLKEAENLLRKGALRAVLVIPPDFSKKIYRGETSDVQVLIDGGYPYTSITIKGYAEAIVSSYNRRLLKERIERSGSLTSPVPVKAQTRYLFNESLRSSYALIPGLIAIVLLMNPAVLTAIAVAREKEFGTIYNIYSTPVKKIEFLLGKIIPYLIISTINFFVVVATVKVLFAIPMKGSIFDLIPPAIVYVLINVSIGLLISSVTRTVVSAQIVTLIVTIIPAFLYSGLLIPVSNLGTEGKVMAHIYPTMYFMDVIHGVYLKRLGLFQMMKEMGMLILYFILLFSFSVMVFKKREG
ncbi:inner membrane transport permease YbhS [bacterium BMS3Bbin06]|nr:inner membrane transport permease YbhS [bacterium BMS3Abin08]GBE33564.1 inner membrane transport permease YbhS [bacterium BMS3Bbin06]